MKIRNILSTIILVLVLTLTVGFSAFVSEMSISNIVSVVRIEKDVRITGLSLLAGSSVSGKPNVTAFANFDADKILAGNLLNNIDNYLNFGVTITNIGSAEVGVFDIITPEGIDYELSDYQLKDKLCDSSDKCSLGISKTFKIKVFPISEVGLGLEKFSIEFDFREFHSVTYDGITNNGYTTEVIDGDSLSVTFSEDIPKNIEVYSDGVLLGSDKYSYTNNTLNIYSVTGNIVIKKGVPVAKLVSGDLTTIGSEVCIEDECFYIINNDGTTVTMLAKYNLYVFGTYYNGTGQYDLYGDSATGVQNPSMLGFVSDSNVYEGVNYFSETAYWNSSSSYPSYVYNSNSLLYKHVEKYKDYLMQQGAKVTSARLISYEELVALGCDGTKKTCSSAPSWVYFSSYWTGSASDNSNLFYVRTNMMFDVRGHNFSCYFGVRPVIEILEEDIVNPFEVKVVSGNVNTAGSEVCLGTECFYVLSSTNDSVTMLSKYNLYVGNSVDEEWNITPLSNPTGIQDSSARGLIYDSDDLPVYPRIGTVAYSTGDTAYSGSIIEGHVNNYVTYLEKLGVTVNSSRLLLEDDIYALS